MKRCHREKAYLNGEISLTELKIILEKDNLDNLVELGISVGLTYDEIMRLDPKNFYLVFRARLKYLEKLAEITNDLNLKQAVKIQQARFDFNGFKKNCDGVKLVSEDALEKTARIANSNEIPKEVIRENILRGD